MPSRIRNTSMPTFQVSESALIIPYFDSPTSSYSKWLSIPSKSAPAYRIAPVSRVTDATLVNDSTAAVSIDAFDNLSGPWRYDVYVQYDSGAWFLAAENVPMDSTAYVRVYDGINHGFYVVCTDEAGNVEKKQAQRELSLSINGGVVTDVDVMPVDNGMTDNNDVFDLQGRKRTKALPAKGVYIQGGKKRIVK